MLERIAKVVQGAGRVVIVDVHVLFGRFGREHRRLVAGGLVARLRALGRSSADPRQILGRLSWQTLTPDPRPIRGGPVRVVCALRRALHFVALAIVEATSLSDCRVCVCVLVMRKVFLFPLEDRADHHTNAYTIYISAVRLPWLYTCSPTSWCVLSLSVHCTQVNLNYSQANFDTRLNMQILRGRGGGRNV